MSSWSPPNSEHPPPKVGEPELHRAARLGESSTITSLVEAGADIDELFDLALDPGARPQPATPLMVAAGSGEGASQDTVSLLLELGASTGPAPSGLSAIFYACAGLGWNYPPGGDAERLRVLLAAGSDPNNTRPGGGRGSGTPLSRAARTGDPDRVRLLLQAGAQPNVGSPALPFEVPIYEAAASGSAECVQLLLAAGATWDFELTDRQNPVIASAGSLEVLSVLLEAGANPSRPCALEMTVAGEIAERSDTDLSERVAMLQRLVQEGVDLEDGYPLARVAMGGNADAVQALLSAGADPHGHRNPMAMVCFSFSDSRSEGIERTVRLLAEAGIDPNDVDQNGFRPLHAALSPDAYGPGYQESDGFNLAAAIALIDLGASIDLEFPDTGYRPLHAAADAGSDELVERLLAEGADRHSQTAGGATALDVATGRLASLRESVANDRLGGTPSDRLQRQKLARNELAVEHTARCVELLKHPGPSDT